MKRNRSIGVFLIALLILIVLFVGYYFVNQSSQANEKALATASIWQIAMSTSSDLSGKLH